MPTVYAHGLFSTDHRASLRKSRTKKSCKSLTMSALTVDMVKAFLERVNYYSLYPMVLHNGNNSLTSRYLAEEAWDPLE